MGESTAFRGEFIHSFYVPVIAIYAPVIAKVRSDPWIDALRWPRPINRDLTPIYSACSPNGRTAKCKPSALKIAIKLLKPGLPCGDRVRYSCVGFRLTLVANA